MSFSIAINLPVHLELHGESDNDEEPELSWLHTNKEQTWVFAPSSSTSSVRQVLTVTSFNVDTKAIASGGGTLQVFAGSGSGQSHSNKMNVRFVCATDLQEITLIRKEGDIYKERLEVLQGTVVPEYRGYALKTPLVGGTALAAIALYSIPENARAVVLPLNDASLPNRLQNALIHAASELHAQGISAHGSILKTKSFKTIFKSPNTVYENIRYIESEDKSTSKTTTKEIKNVMILGFKVSKKSGKCTMDPAHTDSASGVPPHPCCKEMARIYEFTKVPLPATRAPEIKRWEDFFPNK